MEDEDLWEETAEDLREVYESAVYLREEENLGMDFLASAPFGRGLSAHVELRRTSDNADKDMGAEVAYMPPSVVGSTYSRCP